MRKIRMIKKEKKAEANKKWYLRNRKKILQKNKKYYEKNKEEIANNPKQKEQKKKYRLENKERLALKNKEWYEKNKKEILKKCKNYRDENKEKNALRHYKYYIENKEKIIIYRKEWYEKNRERLDKKRLEMLRNRYQNDFKYKIGQLIRNRFKDGIKKFTKNGKTKALKEYGIDIKTIVEKLGEPPDDGKQYHIDHILPVSAFDLENLEHIKLCWHPDNLQWLEASENIKKNDKYNVCDFENYIKKSHTQLTS